MRCRFHFAAVAILLTLEALAFAQYPPGQYPPGQYPPGQYPPGQYPPNTYPDNYPARLPGGIPINLPVPELKFPKKQPKDKPVTSSHDDMSITIASVEGSLRKMGEKDLLLQTSSKVVLRFRLLTKTQFKNKEGTPIRDSLLHPGDRLTIEANTDDEETALRVILDRNGTPAERKAAEQPVEEASVRAPTTEDLSKPHAVPIHQASPGESEPAPVTDTSSGAAPPATEQGAGIPVDTMPRHDAKPATDSGIIADARSAASMFSSGLPNFLVEQATTRYFSQRYQSSWRQLDVVTADVAYVSGKEEYRNVKIDGARVNAPPQDSGTWTTGDFGTTLEDVLSVGTNAKFTRRGEDHIAGHATIIFDYSVAQEHSHWIMVSPDQRRYNPAYSGSIWVDPDTGRVLRLEQHTTFIPPDFSFSRADCILEYAYTRIGANTYLLPSGGENIACVSGSGACSRNVLVFRNYRKFTTDSVIKYFAAGSR